MNISGVNVSGAMADAPEAAAEPRRTFSPPSDREPSEQNPAVSREQVKQIVDEMQSQIDRISVSLQFTTYGDKGENIAVVVSNKDTGEVIREIPAKEIQQLYAKMSELAGMILNGQM